MGTSYLISPWKLYKKKMNKMSTDMLISEASTDPPIILRGILLCASLTFFSFFFVIFAFGLTTMIVQDFFLCFNSIWFEAVGYYCFLCGKLGWWIYLYTSMYGNYMGVIIIIINIGFYIIYKIVYLLYGVFTINNSFRKFVAFFSQIMYIVALHLFCILCFFFVSPFSRLSRTSLHIFPKER